MYFINHPITANAPKKALTKPQTSGALKSCQDKCVISNTAAPAIMGAESKKETLAPAARVSPKSRAAVMVIPLRDTPGIMANACAQPIRRKVLNGIEKISVPRVFRLPRLSAHHNRSAKPIKQAAIISGFLKVCSAQSFNRNPGSS